MKFYVTTLYSLLLVMLSSNHVESQRSWKNIFNWNLFGKARTPTATAPRCRATEWTKDCPRDTLKQTRTLENCTVESRACIREGKLVAEVFMASFAMEQGSGGSTESGNKRTMITDGFVGRGFNIKETSGSKRVTADKCEETKSADSKRLLFGNCGSTPRFAASGRQRRSVYGLENNLNWMNDLKVLPFAERHLSFAQRDILFLMDESGSIGSARFEKIKTIAAAIVRLLCDAIAVGRDKTRVAAMSFDRLQHEHFNFNRYLYRSADEVAQRIKNIRYSRQSQGKTCLKKALDHSIDEIFTTRNGARTSYGSNVRQDIILISDGCENCDSMTALRNTVNRFSGDNTNIYVIGVNLNEDCKDKLKVLARGGSCNHFFFLDEWDYRVDDFINELQNPPQDFCLPKWTYPTTC